MLVLGYLGRHPERVSHAVVVEPGILNPVSAREFVRRFKTSQSLWDALPLVKYMLLTPFVSGKDGHERFDYVMTRLMNRQSLWLVGRAMAFRPQSEAHHFDDRKLSYRHVVAAHPKVPVHRGWAAPGAFHGRVAMTVTLFVVCVLEQSVFRRGGITFST